MKLTRLLSIFMLLALLLTQAVAATLEDYRARLEKALAYATELSEVIGEDDKNTERDLVAAIRTAVPASERVDFAGGSIETDNEWLRSGLDRFEAEKDDAARYAIVDEIIERLSALTVEIRELETAMAATRSKDEDKQKLDEILRRAEYQKPEPREESLFQKWWREFKEWLARTLPSPNLAPGSAMDFSSVRTVLQVVIFALLIALIGFIVWRLAPFISARFGDRVKKKRGDRVILGERIGADESAADLFSEADALARDGNLRGAIRKGYIAVLCELGDRKVVRLARHKTNRDYLRDVRKVEGLFQNMSGLTRSFERTWYGLSVPEQQDWDEFRVMYRRTVTETGRGGR